MGLTLGSASSWDPYGYLDTKTGQIDFRHVFDVIGVNQHQMTYAEIQDEIATPFEEFADEYFTSNEVQDNLMNEYDIDNYVLTAPNNETEFEINMN